MKLDAGILLTHAHASQQSLMFPFAGVHVMLMGFMKGLKLPKEKALPSFAGARGRPAESQTGRKGLTLLCCCTPWHAASWLLTVCWLVCSSTGLWKHCGKLHILCDGLPGKHGWHPKRRDHHAGKLSSTYHLPQYTVPQWMFWWSAA